MVFSNFRLILTQMSSFLDNENKNDWEELYFVFLKLGMVN